MPPDFSAPLAVAELLRGWSRPWCIAGGWALDLWRGEVTREHADVEIAIVRRDQHALREHLTGFVFEKVDPPGQLAPWDEGETLVLPVHEVHARSPKGQVLEVLLNEADERDWLFRREPAVRRSLGQWMERALGGVPVLAPEIVLLYKAKEPRDRDEADLMRNVERLSAEARGWLVAAIERVHPGSAWVDVVRGAEA